MADTPKSNRHNFTAFRQQAERCFHHAQIAADHDMKLRWTTLGETWLAFADELGRRWSMPESEPQSGILSYTLH